MTEETLPRIEFGQAFMVAPGVEYDPAVESMIKFDINRYEELLDFLKDVNYLERFQKVEMPRVDALNRFHSVGWRGSFTSRGYSAFATHFKCNKSHLPTKLTLGFMWDLLKQLVRQSIAERKYRDE